MEDELVFVFSGSGVTDFVVSSSLGFVVLIVFGVVVSKLEISGILLKID